MHLLLALILFSFGAGFAQEAPTTAIGDAQKLYTIQKILVEGTRLPTLSVIRLAKVKAGDQVNFAILHQALQRVAKTGLIENIDFEYESVPDSETHVVLRMKCKDHPPSAKAVIDIPKVKEDDVWTWLQGVDALFTREMPPTVAAINFYAANVARYIETHGEPDFNKDFAVIADATSSTGGSETDRLVFKVAKRRALK